MELEQRTIQPYFLFALKFCFCEQLALITIFDEITNSFVGISVGTDFSSLLLRYTPACDLYLFFVQDTNTKHFGMLMSQLWIKRWPLESLLTK